MVNEWTMARGRVVADLSVAAPPWGCVVGEREGGNTDKRTQNMSGKDEEASRGSAIFGWLDVSVSRCIAGCPAASDRLKISLPVLTLSEKFRGCAAVRHRGLRAQHPASNGGSIGRNDSVLPDF